MNEYTMDSLKIGLEASFAVTIKKEMMNLFLELSGDNNPLHCDAEYAKECQYPDVVVYGMLTSSFYSRLVGVYLPGKYCLLQECNINYREPVFIGDHLTVRGIIQDIQEGIRRITVKAEIVNESGKKVSNAKLVVGVSK